METISANRSHGGTQGVYSHQSAATGTTMTFSVFVPDHTPGARLPVLWYLSGLTCTHANVMEKGEYRKAAAEHGVIIVCPDTSPRGNDVPDELTNWQMGKGAGFYLDATEAPWSENYQMYSYVTEELPAFVSQHFRVDMIGDARDQNIAALHGGDQLVIALPQDDARIGGILLLRHDLHRRSRLLGLEVEERQAVIDGGVRAPLRDQRDRLVEASDRAVARRNRPHWVGS